MKNTNIKKLHNNDIYYVGGAACECPGGKKEYNRYINEAIDCIIYCYATYGEADAFLFTNEYSIKRGDKCSLMRLFLYEEGFTITYKKQYDLSKQLAKAYK